MARGTVNDAARDERPDEHVHTRRHRIARAVRSAFGRDGRQAAVSLLPARIADPKTMKLACGNIDAIGPMSVGFAAQKIESRQRGPLMDVRFPHDQKSIA
jgi:hypothetical protein